MLRRINKKNVCLNKKGNDWYLLVLIVTIGSRKVHYVQKVISCGSNVTGGAGQ